MTADAAETGPEQRRQRWHQRKRWRTLIALLIVFAFAIAALWHQRRSVATGFIDDELAKRGVPARYTVADIGFARQRLTNVVIGDPRDPDLVADWVVVRTRIRGSGPEVTGIDAGHVRLRARWQDGALSLGAIDKLLPKGEGKAPFAPPKLTADIADARIRLELPDSVVGLKLSGAGRLDDGFTGRLALVSDRQTVSGCTATGIGGAFALKIARQRPSLSGPVRAVVVRCGDAVVRALGADIDVTLGEALDRWAGKVAAVAKSAGAPGLATGPLSATIAFDGTAQGTTGDLRLTADNAAMAQGRVARAELAGRYRLAPAGLEFAGDARIAKARAADPLVRQIAALGQSAARTPVGPLAAALAKAGAVAARDVSGSARIEAVQRGDARAVRVIDLTLRSASGAVATVSGDPIRFGAVEVGGQIAVRGGGLPAAAVALRRAGGGLAGRAVVEPYAVNDARLALTPVTFQVIDGAVTRVVTQATLSGPIADGRIDGVQMPIDVRWRGRAMVANPGCTPVAWQRLQISSLTLDPTRLRVCAGGAGLVMLARGRINGTARLGATRLTGRIGSTPLALTVSGAQMRLGDLGFALADVKTRLGAPDRVTRIDAGRLTGRIAGGRVAGSYADGGGQIGNVPLVLSAASGDWAFAGGKLTLGGRLMVADAAKEPRFEPLASENVALTLVGNRIDASGTLIHPTKRVKVADVTIMHDLARGAGTAGLSVPGIAFGKAFQPNELTRLTFGVIADVVGSVSGAGRIAWSPDGVISTGKFGTQGLDLAAAFGPVTGLKGDIVFTDLLGLVSAPDQVATIATVNPGIAVENGTVRYRLTGNNRVQVEGGEWPFAGGRLTLDPTLLDFNDQQQRRMTFRVVGVDAGAFLQQFDFDNLNATGTFDGVLPMVFDDSGGRIVDGKLAARSGGSIAYVGTITEKDLGVWGNMAFQALRSLNYRSLNITLNGPLSGEMVTAIQFAGVSQGQGTKSNFIIRRLARLPFVFNITIRAPFRQLLDSVRSYYDPSRLIQRNLPALIEAQSRREGPQPHAAPVIQPPVSEKRP
ncbi:YdbH domain-containing protein [uncultured Sphingomonas sp.]|uniref:YdbH domain-containing protein n=1 Tax=uncultured Sphingomonas sp. TaxID=158754 RepID=UPI0025EAB97A|nr:YdbH domain-containing protein [uncultured Sphingomonas sp.]